MNEIDFYFNKIHNMYKKNASHQDMLDFVNKNKNIFKISQLNSLVHYINTHFNPKIQVLPHLCAFVNRFQKSTFANVAAFEDLLNEFRDFVHKACSKQLNAFVSLLAECVSTIMRLSSSFQVLPALSPLLLYLLNKLQSCQEESEITELDADFLLLCLKIGNLKAAFRRLPSFDACNTLKISPFFRSSKQLLAYFYYSGVIFAIYQKYPESYVSFLTVLTIPSRILSKISCEASKKLALISLMLNVKKPFLSLPSFAPLVNQKFCKTSEQLKAYKELSQAFHSLDCQKFSNKLLEHAVVLSSDSNENLAKVCLEHLRSKIFLNLANAFTKITLSNLTQRCQRIFSSCDEGFAEEYILKLNRENKIHARIDAKNDNLVHFSQSPSSKVSFNDTDSLINQCMQMRNGLKALDRQLSLSAPLLQKSCNEKYEETTHKDE